MRMRRVVPLILLLAVGPVLAGCSNFDPDNLDVFGLNEKKKLPGERKELFPSGVPGVTQGIPPEYLKGNQPTPETAQTSPDAAAAQAKTAAAAPAEEAKPKAKPKPRTASRPTRVTVQPAAQQQQSAPWPEPQQQQQQSSQSPWPAPSQSSSTAPWPSSPAPGTFSKQ